MTVENVPFQVWYASNNTSTGEYNDLGVYYTDEDGRIVLSDPELSLRDGWFRVKELDPAPGFALADPDTQEAFIAAGEGHTFRFTNRPLSAICVWKYDSETGAAIEGAGVPDPLPQRKYLRTRRHRNRHLPDLNQWLLYRHRLQSWHLYH